VYRIPFEYGKNAISLLPAREQSGMKNLPYLKNQNRKKSFFPSLQVHGYRTVFSFPKDAWKTAIPVSQRRGLHASE